MAKTFSVRLPASHPHISQTFHLLWDHTEISQAGSAPSDATNQIYVTAIADHNDLLSLAAPDSFAGSHMRDYVQTSKACRMPLVIDGATEGWSFEPSVFERFHQNLALLEVDPRDVLIITTNYLLPPAYETWAGSTSFQPVSFFVFDFWCYKLSAQLREQLDAAGAQTELNAPNFHVDSKLLSFNRVPKAHRAAVILKLIESKQLGESLVSFMPDVAHTDAAATSAMLAYYKSLGWPTLDRLLELWPDLANRIPIVHDQDAGTEYLTYVFGNMRSPDYGRVGFTVITESDFGVGSVDRVTEKPFKAVANHCPYLIVGQHKQLARMRSLGFEPYEMFDNSYDDIADPDQRLASVLGEMDRLARLSCGQLQALRRETHETTVRNFEQLRSYSSKARIDAVAANLSRALTRVSARRSAP